MRTSEQTITHFLNINLCFFSSVTVLHSMVQHPVDLTLPMSNVGDVDNMDIEGIHVLSEWIIPIILTIIGET